MNNLAITTETLTIGQESLGTFFEKYIPKSLDHQLMAERGPVREGVHLPSFIQNDEILVRKEIADEGNKWVVFIFEEETSITKKKMVSSITYEIQRYDDLCCKLVKRLEGKK